MSRLRTSVIFITKIKTTTRIIGLHFKRTRTRIIVIQKTKMKQKLKFWEKTNKNENYFSEYEKSWLRSLFCFQSQKIQQPLTNCIMQLHVRSRDSAASILQSEIKSHNISLKSNIQQSALSYSSAGALRTEVCISAAVCAICRGHCVCARLMRIHRYSHCVDYVQWQVQLNQ